MGKQLLDLFSHSNATFTMSCWLPTPSYLSYLFICEAEWIYFWKHNSPSSFFDSLLSHLSDGLAVLSRSEKKSVSGTVGTLSFCAFDLSNLRPRSVESKCVSQQDLLRRQGRFIGI